MITTRTPLPVTYNVTIIGWWQPWDRGMIPATRASFWNVLRILKSASFYEKTSFRVHHFGFAIMHITYYAPFVKSFQPNFWQCAPLIFVCESKLRAAAVDFFLSINLNG
jgi:hypothetical protein